MSRILLTLAALVATAPASQRRPPPLPLRSTIRIRRTGCACRDARTSARRRSERRRSIPTATARSAKPVAKNPPLDCFYVYPTVSRDSGMNSDLVADASERGAAQIQFARFAGVCRTFAPIYRQMTLGAVAAAAAGADMTRPRFHRLCGCRDRLAHLSRAPQQGPPVRAHRPQPGLADAAGADQARDRGQADRAADAPRDPARLQSAACRRAGGSAARSRARPSALRRARPAA